MKFCVPSRIFSFRRWFTPRNDAASRIYLRLMQQARNPVFYSAFAVPDTPDGRYDMIVLHIFILFHRLRQDIANHELAQDVFDILFKDLDCSLREMGVGDLSVPRRIKELARILYGCVDAYEKAVREGGRKDLAGTIARNVFRVDEIDMAALGLADYVLASIGIESIGTESIGIESVGIESGGHENEPRCAKEGEPAFFHADPVAFAPQAVDSRCA